MFPLAGVDGHRREWQVFDICFYSFLLLQHIIYNAVNTLGPFDIFAVRIFSLPCSCKSKQVFSI